LGPVVGGLNGLDQRPKGVDLADMVNQSEQRPLYIHFPLGTQGKAMHPLLYTEVGKDRVSTGSVQAWMAPWRHLGAGKARSHAARNA